MAVGVGLTGCRANGHDTERGTAGQGQPARPAGPLDTIPETPTADLYPAAPSPQWAVTERPLTDRTVAATHNNFYEFLLDKARVWENVGPFQARPWTVEVTGEVERPGIFDLDVLERELGLEERVYRLRCVEAWAMTVPWTGFPLHRLLDRVQPLSSGPPAPPPGPGPAPLLGQLCPLRLLQPPGRGGGPEDPALVSVALLRGPPHG